MFFARVVYGIFQVAPMIVLFSNSRYDMNNGRRSRPWRWFIYALHPIRFSLDLISLAESVVLSVREFWVEGTAVRRDGRCQNGCFERSHR
jgi:hypothetical protein